jgi:hypothetical protein
MACSRVADESEGIRFLRMPQTAAPNMRETVEPVLFFAKIPCKKIEKRSWILSKQIDLCTESHTFTLRAKNGKHRAFNAVCILHDLLATILKKRGNWGDGLVLYITDRFSDTGLFVLREKI